MGRARDMLHAGRTSSCQPPARPPAHQLTRPRGKGAPLYASSHHPCFSCRALLATLSRKLCVQSQVVSTSPGLLCYSFARLASSSKWVTVYGLATRMVLMHTCWVDAAIKWVPSMS